MEKSLNVQIAQMLKAVREKKGVSQVELARRLRINQSNVSQMESGRRLVSLNMMEKVAEALGGELILPYIK